MPRRVKEEEKIAMIIRDLLKRPDNRRCINCNTLGPQYICTTFWTFVCTNCGGVHRELNHRVKSVSIATFSDEEVMSLQGGGNERAKQIYFKNWDPKHNSYPESSNLHRLRQFVSDVYIDRKYCGGSSSNRLPLANSESKNTLSDWLSDRSPWGRRDDSMGRSPVDRSSNYSSGSDEFYDRSFFERSSSAKGGKGLNLKDFLEERSPRSSHELPRSSSQRSRSTHFEIIDDRFRENGSVKRYDRSSVREPGSGGRSPLALTSAASSPRALTSPASLPVIRPLSVFMGDKSPELVVSDEGSAKSQKAAEAGTKPTVKENDLKNPTSLIDFLEIETSSTVQEPPHEEQKALDASNKAAATFPITSVESLLFELSAPPVASYTDSTPHTPPVPPQQNATDASKVEAAEEAPRVSNSCQALAIMTSDQPLHREETNPMMQAFQTHQFSTTLQSASSVQSLHEQGSRSPVPDDLRRTRSVPAVQSLEVATAPSSSARKEIPEDLFTSSFHSFTPPVAAWHMHMPPAAGYNMPFHHPHATPVAVYQNSAKPKNPFDIDDDRFQVEAATFPPSSSLQGAFLPNMATAPVVYSQPIPPYAAALSPQPHIASYGMNMPLVPGAYMAQVSNNMLLTRPEGNGNFGRSEEDAFASLNPITRGNGAYSLPTTTTTPTYSLPRGGNPFG